MFTGIVEETGRVEDVQKTSSGISLQISAVRAAESLNIGDSIAVNGCCLTVVHIDGNRAGFDLLRETWDRTNLQFVTRGSLVNLERPLRANGRLDGHFVTGHIDGLGRIARWERSGADHVLEIAPPPELLRQIVQKGSIAVDGISLTVAAVSDKTFTVWIIPHTYQVTALRERKIGDAVNLETDILGKYIEKMLLAK
ncbi:MAG TPA: riboflavin synthase [Candidatus Binatia bacterium]|nr:riboflavin synthase [Candidatus Binatia bacterium]